METIQAVNFILGEMPASSIGVLQNAINERRRRESANVANQNAATLQIGNKVRLKGLSPKMLNGHICEVLSIGTTSAKLRMPVDYRLRRRSGISCVVPLSCMEKVS